ncbi:uncharacterized protein LOC121388573 [Gigantopelta aegis]|uniref:uncharacterized protein LOC121388573 n=1 Tax=Gigantopelta aegis TaxID=1735272 RepID=UPI001B88A2A2|nr:uncharacterized protein LOC121388573 [Gigantopelta aegis]XP_041375896.1 uncharacterized protein LOC121388573 [Gigantopelta aegis]XP_041375897.1 uncharacterized protein LOC121388573 [Gigantopelta aegis]
MKRVNHPGTSGADVKIPRLDGPDPVTDLKSIIDQQERCQSVVKELEDLFRESTNLHPLPRVKDWRKRLQKIKKQLDDPPQITIAVVGESGVGKSSMLNALFDQSSLLPTSAMRACTAVVVKVSANTDNLDYEADIEFLSEEEWYDEVKLLIEDLTDKNGKLHSSGGNPRTTVSGAAFEKVNAVYGKVEPLDSLKENRKITKCLGSTEKIKSRDAVDLRLKVEKYIDSGDASRDGQYWPIIKSVHIRVPNLDIFKSGLVFVDLPGVGDSNLARNKIAGEYLKDSSHVWVVATIQRAVDNSIAKQLLGKHFRRQLYMDGQYGSLAFICTQIDVITPSEIKKANIMTPEEECEFIKLDLEKKELLQQCKELKSQPQNTERKLEILEFEERMKNIDKAISALAAKARNEFSTKRIKHDFRAGLRELEQKAGEPEQDEEDDELEEFGNSDDQKEEEESTTTDGDLSVFCVSAAEYMKLKEFLDSTDGLAKVFSKPDETGIPKLRDFVQKMAVDNRKTVMKEITEETCNLFLDLQDYLAILNPAARPGSEQIVSVVNKHVKEVDTEVKAIATKLSTDISETFKKEIFPNLVEGVCNGKRDALEISEKWRSLHKCATYKATVGHHGTYSSRVAGAVTFNEDLAAPVLDSIASQWTKVFNDLLWQHFDNVKEAMLDAIHKFFTDTTSDLLKHDVQADDLDRISGQIGRSIETKLTEMVKSNKVIVNKKQRDCSRRMPEILKEHMRETYEACNRKRGSGSFDRMRKEMTDGVEKNVDVMYVDGSRDLKEQLETLQKSVVVDVKKILLAICDYLKASYEPLWKVTPELSELEDRFATCIGSGIEQIKENYEELGIVFPIRDTTKKGSGRDSLSKTMESLKQKETDIRISEAQEERAKQRRKRKTKATERE